MSTLNSRAVLCCAWQIGHCVDVGTPIEQVMKNLEDIVRVSVTDRDKLWDISRTDGIQAILELEFIVFSDF